MTTRLSTKGQLVIPKEIREHHGWAPGVELEIEDRGDHVIVRPAGEVPETSLDDLIGCARYEGPARSLEEMEAGIAEGARRSHPKGRARR
jgi:AbrB family looped-hinge helix DNA binding protein